MVLWGLHPVARPVHWLGRAQPLSIWWLWLGSSWWLLRSASLLGDYQSAAAWLCLWQASHNNGVLPAAGTRLAVVFIHPLRNWKRTHQRLSLILDAMSKHITKLVQWQMNHHLDRLPLHQILCWSWSPPNRERRMLEGSSWLYDWTKADKHLTNHLPSILHVLEDLWTNNIKKEECCEQC